MKLLRRRHREDIDPPKTPAAAPPRGPATAASSLPGAKASAGSRQVPRDTASETPPVPDGWHALPMGIHATLMLAPASATVAAEVGAGDFPGCRHGR